MTLRSLFTASSLILAGMTAGCVLGLLREVMIATRFGTGSVTDFAILLLILPELMAAALIGSAASPMLVPQLAARDDHKAKVLFTQVAISALAGLVLLVAGFSLASGWLTTQLSASMPPPEAQKALLINLWAIPLIGLTHLSIAYLQYRSRFAMPAFSNAIFNSVVVAGLLLMEPDLATFAIFVVLAALTRLALHAIAFRRSGGAITTGGREVNMPLFFSYLATTARGLCALLPQYVPYLVIAAAGSGIALFNYAFKLVGLPGIVGMTLAQMALLPWFVALTKNATIDAQRHAYAGALRFGWIFCWCVCLTLTLSSEQVATLFFGYGKMTPEDVAAVAKLFAVGVWAMPGMLLVAVWQQIFYANHNTRAPLIAAIVQAVLIIVLAWMGERVMGPMGVMIAYIAAQLVPLIVLAHEGKKWEMIASILPGQETIVMSAIALIVFIPSALMFRALAPSPAAGLLLAALIGLFMLIAALLSSSDVRRYLSSQMRRT